MTSRPDSPLPPLGPTLRLGVLGGGQLGRMMIQEAMNWDIRVEVMDPSDEASCRHLTHRFVQGDLNDANNRQYSKKWNPKTERWEQRYPNENPFTMVKNQVSYWIQNAKQEKARNQRPEPESLSDRGGKLPGVGKDDEYVYLIQYGVVRYGGKDGPVCGLWTAQPITNVPAWERS